MFKSKTKPTSEFKNWLTLDLDHTKEKSDPDKLIEFVVEPFDEKISKKFGQKDINKNELDKFLISHNKDVSKKANEAKKAILDGKIVNIINLPVYKPDSENFDNYLYFGEKPSENTHINYLVISKDPGQIPNINNLNIRKLELVRGKSNSHDLKIENCWIDKLIIKNDSKRNLTISNCQIGHIVFNSECLRRLKIENSCILSLSCPPPDAEKNPFFGQINIHKNNYFSLGDKEYTGQFKTRGCGYQQYSNMRHHLVSIQDIEAASLIQRVEQRLERRDLIQKKFYLKWFLSNCYEVFSDYGNSIGRPLFMILCIFISIWVNFSYPYTMQIHNRFNYSWLNNLRCDDINFDDRKVYTTTKLCPLTALDLSLQTLNPIGFVFGNNHIIPATPTLNRFYALYRFLISIFIFLFFVAIRRKFRLNI